MFQVTNPLKFYSQNPNLDDQDEPDEVPNLTESQIRLKKTNKTISNVIYFCIGFLILILLATLGLTLYHKIKEGRFFEEAPQPSWIEVLLEQEPRKDIRNCSECLDFERVKDLAEVDVPGAEIYINETVTRAIDTHLDEATEKLASLGGVTEKMASIPDLKLKIDELLRLNATFGSALAETSNHENDIKELRIRFGMKNRTLAEYQERAINSLQDIADLERTKKDLEDELKALQKEIDDRLSALDLDRKDIKGRVSLLEKRIADILAEIEQDSEQKLDELIVRKTALINDREKDKGNCETSLVSYYGEHDTLAAKQILEQRHLEEIELQLSRWKWVNHVLETIKKFEDIRDQLIDLRDSQLQEGKENINKMVEHLKTKIDELVSELSKLPAEDVQSSENTEVIVDENRGTTTIVTVQRSRRSGILAKIYNLKLYIEREKELLKTWAHGQFTVYNISTHEINNVTATIRSLEDSLKDQTREYKHFLVLKEETITTIETLTTTMKRIESSIQRCQELVDDSEEKIRYEQEELDNLEGIRRKVRGIRDQIADEEASLGTKHSGLVRDVEDLTDRRNDLAGRITVVKSDQDTKERSLRSIVSQINELIVDSPQPDTVRKSTELYNVRVKSTNEVVKQLARLIEEIKRFI